MNYQTEIVETSEYLLQLERETKDLKARDRVRFIRLLKTGHATTQKQAGALLGLRIRQSQRLWREYREGGLSKMCQSRYMGGVGKFEQARRNELEARLKRDDIQTLEQARDCLSQEFGARYSIGGVSYLFKQMKIKLKTGRPLNVKQEAAEREAFAKKNIPT
jgi:transposase